MGPRKGTTGPENNENRPETSPGLVHDWHFEDTMAVCDPSFAGIGSPGMVLEELSNLLVEYFWRFGVLAF